MEDAQFSLFFIVHDSFDYLIINSAALIFPLAIKHQIVRVELTAAVSERDGPCAYFLITIVDLFFFRRDGASFLMIYATSNNLRRRQNYYAL